MAKSANKQSFDIRIVSSKAFSLFIANFQAATTILFEIIESIDVNFIASLIGKATTVINSKRIRLLVSQVKLRVSLTQTINSKRISLAYTFRQILKAVTLIDLQTSLIFISSAKQKATTILSSKKITLITDPILATFYTLGTYDPSTLGTMDTETLGELDYLVT